MGKFRSKLLGSEPGRDVVPDVVSDVVPPRFPAALVRNRLPPQPCEPPLEQNQPANPQECGSLALARIHAGA